MSRPRPHDCPYCVCGRAADDYDPGVVDPTAPFHRLVLDVMRAADPDNERPQVRTCHHNDSGELP